MIIFPAIDIMDGRCVQLVQGKRESAASFGSPLSWAEHWIREGAEALHVINLDGAFGQSGKNAGLLRSLIRDTGIPVQLGGGIRSREDAVSWLDTGVERIILGTLAKRSPEALTGLATEFGKERIMAGVDAKGGQVAIEGWQETAGDYLEWARIFTRCGAGSLLYTNIDVEGLQQGIRIKPVRSLINEVCIPVIVAGGVSSVSDVRDLIHAGAMGAVLGSALYSGKITLMSAMEVCR